MMAPGKNTILVTSFSSVMAHVVRPLQVAKYLRKLGYRVVFSGTGKPLRIVAQAGFEIVPLPEWDLQELLKKIRGNSKEVHTLDQVEAWVSAEMDLYKTLRPAAILDDARVTTYISSAAAGIPRISLHNAYVHQNAVRGFMDPSLNGPRSIMEPGDEAPYNQVLAEYGLPSVAHLSDLLEGDLNLLCDIPEYAPLHTVPNHYHYVGPIIWGEDLDVPPWFSDLAAADKPTLYVTMGSTGAPQIFQAVVDRLRGRDYQVVMTLGSILKEEDLGDLPPSFYCTAYASGTRLARRADAIICHGGNGTVYQALSVGVPMITWPSVKDQHWNARRLSEFGVSVNISSGEELIPAVEEVLTNPAYRIEARRISELLKKYNGPEYSASLIHQFLKGLSN